MKRDLGLTFTIIVSMATFAIVLVAGIFLIWETRSASAHEAQPSHGVQITRDEASELPGLVPAHEGASL